MKFHPIPAMLGLIMIISGYGLALDIFRGNASLWLTVGFYPIGLLTMLLVVVGTVLLITFSCPMPCRKESKISAAFITLSVLFPYQILFTASGQMQKH